MNILSDIWHSIQQDLFPALERDTDPLTEKEKHFTEVLTMTDLPFHMREYQWQGAGRKRKLRISIARAFIAKAVHNLPTTDMLIELLKGNNRLRLLCEWENRYEVPSESTFSRAFAEFAEKNFTQKVHEVMICKYCGSKIAGHVSRDDTPIISREKPAKKKKEQDDTPKQPKRKPGRPRKGESVPPKPPKRLDLQPTRSPEENLNDLPAQCDKGSEKDSQGYKRSWNGYKLHTDCADGDIPVSAILTSASLHDSQAAIPLSQMTNERMTNLYDLTDAAYDAAQIRAFSEQLGHVPITDHNPRGGEKRHTEPATQQRYGERSSAERINSYLKDNYGGRNVRVRSHAKVFTHLMFGVIAIAATQILKLVI